MPYDRTEDFRQDRLLRYVSNELEREFLAYVHPSPHWLFVVGYIVAAIFQTVFMLANPGAGYEVQAGWYTFAAIAESAINVLFWFKKGRSEALLILERWLLTASACVSMTSDYIAAMRLYGNCSAFNDAIILDNGAAYVRPQCLRWWSPFTPLILAFTVAIQIVPLTLILFQAEYSVLVHLTVWLTNPPPDQLYTVWLFTVYVVAGLMFVTYVKYSQEQKRRTYFERFKRLQNSTRKLGVQREQLGELCATLLPRSMMKRLDRVHGTPKTDSAEAGTTLLVGVHEFGRWCTQQRPMEVASSLVQLHLVMRQFADMHRIDTVGCMGDTIVCVGNLIREQLSIVWLTCIAAFQGLREMRQRGHSMPIRAVVHLGQLYGRFVGDQQVRYDVFGPCYDVAQQALAECDVNHVLLSAPAAQSEGVGITSVPSDEITSVSGVRFYGLTSFSQLEAISRSIASAQFLHPQLESSTNEPIDLEHVVNSALKRTSTEVGDDDFVGLNISTVETNAREGAETSVQSNANLETELERYQQVKRVCGIFPVFADPIIEASYIRAQKELLPAAASRIWLAYAAYLLVILGLLIADMHEDGGRGGAAALLLIVAILLSCMLGLAPTILGKERMREWFVAWSVVGIVLPLLAVYGCAVARPSAVGNDTRLLLFIGALIRSYCFTTSLWRTIFLPLAAIVGFGQYALPGAYLRPTTIFVVLLIIMVIVTEFSREKLERRKAMNNIELKVLSSKLRSIDRLRLGLMKAAVPAPVFEHYLYSLGSGFTGDLAYSNEAVVLAVTHIPTTTYASQGVAGLDRLFDALQGMEHLCVAHTLGNQAIVVGPVRPERPEVMLETRPAIEEAYQLGQLLASDAPEDAPLFSLLADNDSVIHAVSYAEKTQYWCLGVTVTRLLTLTASADAASLAGFLVTDRVLIASESLDVESRFESSPVGPMKFRGVGVVRFTRLRVRR